MGVFVKKWKMGGVFCKKKLTSTQGALCTVSVFLFYLLGARTHPLPTGLSLHFTVSRHAPLSIAPFSGGDLEPHLVQGFLGLLESAHQTASRSVHPFLHRPRYIDG